MTDLDPGIFRTVLESLQTGVYVVGTDGKVLFWNDGAENITGFRRHEVIGRSCNENILPHCDKRSCALCGVPCPLANAIREGKPSETQMHLRHKMGHRVPVQIWTVPFRDKTGSIAGVAESFNEQRTDYETENSRLSLAAHGCLDAVTGVMNRALTHSYLREHFAFFTEYDLPFGVLTIRLEELDRFRVEHGREAGEDILHVVASNMKRALGTAGFLGRWSDDEFVAITPNCTFAELTRAGDSVQNSVNSSEIKWWGDLLSVTVSLGRAMVEAGDGIESLLERAELGSRIPLSLEKSETTNSKT